MFIGTCIIVIVEEWKTNLMSLAVLFHFLCAQHVSDINASIIGSLRVCRWITMSVVLFSVRCALQIWCGWFWVVLVLQAEAQIVLQELATVSLNYHIGRLVLSSLCVGDLMRLVLSGARFAGWSTNWEQDDRCGNSTTQSQAPDVGYINVLSMLST